MSYSKNYSSPSKTKYDNESMVKSFLMVQEQMSSPINKRLNKSQFTECFYHSKPIKFLCISKTCQCKYFTLCDHLQCKAMHSHPNMNIIQVQKFEEFKMQHLKSINLLKAKIKQYEKQVLQSVIFKITKDFQMVQSVIDSFYVHKAAKKIGQGRLQELNTQELSEFIEKSILVNEAFGGQQLGFESSLRKDPLSYLSSTFIESKNLISSTIQSLQQSLQKLTLSKEYKTLTLQQCILNPNSSPSKTLVKKQTFTSKIIQFQEQYQTIVKMLKENRIMNFREFKLLYRGSENQFSSEKYHQAVDGKAPWLLIVMAQTGMKFGAFVNCKTAKNNDWISDPTGLSFIFSLDHNQTYRLKSSANHRTKAIFGGSKGPQIGSGCDIYISDKCHENSQSGANFGGSYQLPFGLDFGTKKAKQFLAGKQNFSIKQYQVFLLI